MATRRLRAWHTYGVGVSSDLLSIYREASLARWRATSKGQREEVSRPGLYGLLDAPEHPSVVMLVTDDRSCAQLAEILADAQAGMIHVVATAARSLAMLERNQAWEGSTSTAMVCRMFSQAAHVALPGSFQVRPVRRLDDDPSDGVSLSDAVACVVRAAPRENPEKLAAFLRSLTATSVFAAIDADGEVRATSGYELIGSHARVLLVDTDPA
jgi:hypothetical protein